MLVVASQPGAVPVFRAIGPRALDDLLRRVPFDRAQREAVLATAAVLPFRVNPYVVSELIDWQAVPDDPIFQLTFPQPDMLPPEDLGPVLHYMRQNSADQLRAAARAVRRRLNPHPAGQADLNVPLLDGTPLPGLQHKYGETVLFFPSHGQTCHAYCSYCFRWPQFVGDPELKISGEVSQLTKYVRTHPEITDVLITGGDPLIMSTDNLARCIEPLLAPDLAHITSIRIGTKALCYWPHRFTRASDSGALSMLFERVAKANRQLAIMAHVSHPRELSTKAAVQAVARIRETGAVVRTQAPLIRKVNDSPGIWADIWRTTVNLGGIPYYMFVERDTGPQDYFKVPLIRSWKIFREAYASLSGLARTVRGPSMSATPGKVCVDGVAELGGRQVIVLHYIQARDPSRVGRPFFAKYDPAAAWLTDLTPAGPADEPLFANAAA